MNIANFQSKLDFIKDLYSNEEWTERECRDDILAALEEAHTKIVNAFGESLCRLRYGKHKPSLEAVEKVVKEFPSALSYEDKDGYIPISYISEDNDDGSGLEYIPILAKEGVKHNVGGADARGGLVCRTPNGLTLNNLQNLCTCSDNEMVNLSVLKELRKMGLFVKSDIQDYKMLHYSVYSSCGRGKKRTKFLADWDPDALLNIDSLEIMNFERELDDLEILLLAGFKHFPNTGGILFLQDTAGNTVFDLACRKDYGYGLEGTMSILHKILAPRSDYPILHHVYIKAPEHVPLFAKKFHWAYHLKDHKGRTLHQAVLAAGPDVMNANSQLFASLTDDQLQTKDPIITLYPFAAMAVGEHAELEVVFDLLRRQPSVLERLHG
ncbi:hypothetical protein CTEN210_06368 [Chaetoceros tenuissimus]|uniref:Uncharacterized protein n=1 Tax=Chaetoceros tenuissimus TaxID=426638 RepID=A0AAD3H440_9STRA|nr:hypothetical protein CTEN210_06368 [Chaetoceros tenuissimus]